MERSESTEALPPLVLLPLLERLDADSDRLFTYSQSAIEYKQVSFLPSLSACAKDTSKG